MNQPKIHALIPAAGRGTRYGGDRLKQYLPIGGKAVMSYAINAFQFHPLIASVTVVLADDDQWFESAVGSLSSVVDTVIGGDTRAHSVRNGLKQIISKNPVSDWVLVHDAARPCLAPACLDRLLEEGLKSPDGAILAMPLGDTLKQAGDDGEIIGTVDRSGLWTAQTPQFFPIEKLLSAIESAHVHGHEMTDEASAMELAGFKPKLVMSSAANIKITHPSDLAIAEAWLLRKGQTA